MKWHTMLLLPSWNLWSSLCNCQPSGIRWMIHFDPEYINLNHGEFLDCHTQARCSTWGHRKLLRVSFLTGQCMVQCSIRQDQGSVHVIDLPAPMLIAVHEKFTSFIGVSDVDMVLVPNASHGVNTVLKNFIWEAGDVIVTYQTSYFPGGSQVLIVLLGNTTYGSISRTAQYISNVPPQPEVTQFTILFPTTKEDIISWWRENLQSVREHVGKNTKIVAVVDAIISNPAALLPWEVMTDICCEFDMWSVVDAAHVIGQQTGFQLDQAKLDFWISVSTGI